MTVYVLTNYDTTHQQDLERVYILKELGFNPDIRIYNKQSLPKGHITKKLQSWVNNRIAFNACEKFEDYDERRRGKK